MMIAFEGPDKTGKSTSAKELCYSGVPTYNMNVDNYKRVRESLQGEATITHCFDRIDWLTHLVYRLALPGYEWNDERPRTVFAAPDTHLVFKLHKDASLPTDELYRGGQLAKVNSMYYSWIRWLTELNEDLNYSLYKTISLMEVDLSNGFSQHMVFCSSPNKVYRKNELGHIATNHDLLKFLTLENHKLLDGGRQ